MTDQEEIWLPVVDWEDAYCISSLGNIKSVSRVGINKNGQSRNIVGKTRSTYISNRGYLEVGLSRDGVRRTQPIHILVARAFIDKDYIIKGLVVNHIDGDKTNSRLSNLEITTYSGNIVHAHRSGLNKNFGNTHYKTKLSDNDVLELRRLYSTGKTTTELADAYNIHWQHARDIINLKRRQKVCSPEALKKKQQ